MKVQVRDGENHEWKDVAEGPWFRIVTDAGQIDLLDHDRMLPDGWTVVRVTDDGRLETTPVASNSIGLRSNFQTA